MNSLANRLDQETVRTQFLSEKREDHAVRCLACSHQCWIQPGKRGICKLRFNDGGELRVPHGYVSGLQVDPVEKKPFYHVLTGYDTLSFGMLGCNFHCPFCQNWISSQTLRDDRAGAGIQRISAKQIAAIARKRDARLVVSTYNEPTISLEWAHEVFREVKAAVPGIVCGFVSNGYISRLALDWMDPVLDIMNVDLKTFSDSNYQKIGGRLQPVLDTIRALHEMGKWVEVVTLLVPDFNDSTDEIRKIADFIASVDPNIPWHVSAYRPMYEMNNRPTTPADLLRAIEIGTEAGLRHIYAGNAAGQAGEYENTRCGGCGATLIRRRSYFIQEYRITASGQCPDCGEVVPGIWSEDGRAGSGAGIPRIL